MSLRTPKGKRKKRAAKASVRRRKLTGKKTAGRRRSLSRRRQEPGSIIFRDGKIFMMLPGKLRSPNKIKTGLARHGDTKAWEARILKAQTVQTDQTVKLPATRRARLDIERLVPNRACFLDQRNLDFSAKGLEDALVRLGYLVDDNHEWLDVKPMTQSISPDKLYWASVVIEVL